VSNIKVDSMRCELAEFDRMAIALDISRAERCDILGVTAAQYAGWGSGDTTPAPPQVVRRLRYAVPIMRQSLANQVPPPHFIFSERRL